MSPIWSGTSFLGFGQMKLEVDFSEVQGMLAREANVRQAREFLETASMSVAEKIAEFAREKLSVGGSRDVGATGGASKNIFVMKSGEHDAIIYEGAYPANYFIREGRTKGAKRPPARAIVEWIVHKGITIEKPKDQRGKWRITKYGGPRANLRSKPPRPWKRDMKQVAGIIATKIGQEGMTHFGKLYPSNSNRYDYYGEIMHRTPGEKYFTNMIMERYTYWFPLYREFLRDGRPRRIPRRLIGGAK